MNNETLYAFDHNKQYYIVKASSAEEAIEIVNDTAIDLRRPLTEDDIIEEVENLLVLNK